MSVGEMKFVVGGRVLDSGKVKTARIFQKYYLL